MSVGFQCAVNKVSCCEHLSCMPLRCTAPVERSRDSNSKSHLVLGVLTVIVVLTIDVVTPRWQTEGLRLVGWKHICPAAEATKGFLCSVSIQRVCREVTDSDSYVEMKFCDSIHRRAICRGYAPGYWNAD